MQFARDNPDVTVIGLGAGSSANGDSLDLAYDFVTRFGADTAGLTMIYDTSFRVWRTFGVTTQPWMALFNAEGELVFSQPGRVDMSSVAAALG